MCRNVPVWCCAPGLVLAWLVALFAFQRNSSAEETSERSKDAASPDIRKLFTMHCGKCHGADGKGTAGRTLFPEIPDFTKADWQQRHTDAQLLASILEGKGMGMPGWRDKLTKEQGRKLVRHIRLFGPKKSKETKITPARADDAVAKLQEQFEKLQKEFEALSKMSAAAAGYETLARDLIPDTRRLASGRDSPVPAFSLRLCTGCH